MRKVLSTWVLVFRLIMNSDTTAYDVLYDDNYTGFTPDI